MLDFSLRQYKKEILEALSGLIEIESVKSNDCDKLKPYGKGIFDALMYMLNLAERLDLDNVNLFSHVGYVELGEGDEEIDVLTHLDVVPAGDGWNYPPFKLTHVDGKLYGRGTIDDKGAAVVSLFALHALKQHCVTLNKKVKLIFGCDEESGWKDMDFYLEQFPDEPFAAFSPDSDFPIVYSEKGVAHLILSKKQDFSEGDGLKLKYFKGGSRINIVPDFAECFVEGNADLLERALVLFLEDNKYDVDFRKETDGLYISARGISSHGSMPGNGLNAVMILVAFLNNLPMKISSGSSAVYSLGENIGFETDGKLLKINCVDETGELTVNVGFIDVENEKVSVGIDIRYPKCADKLIILDRIRNAFKGFEIVESHSMPPHYVNPESDLISCLSEAYEEISGLKCECISTGGATYARVFKNSVAFGPVFPGRENNEHSKDEYILLDDLLMAGDIIANAIYKLCN